MHVTLIAALARGRILGTGEGIPWDLPRDKRHFRRYTAGLPLLLGRRTFQEMEGWFTTQTPLVLTRHPDRIPPGVVVVQSVSQAVAYARRTGSPELVVGGGASVYEQALPQADFLVLTQIDLDCEGSATFPNYESSGEWKLTEESRFEADKDHAHAMRFQRWIRIRTARHL